MKPSVEMTPLLEGGLSSIEEAVGYLKEANIDYTIGIANDSVPGS